MYNSMIGFKWKLLIFIMVVGFISGQGVTWSDLPELRMRQASIYDSVYLPVNIDSQVDITYKTAFATAVINPHKALVISGFENYLQFQMIMNVTIVSVDQNKVKINIRMGPLTNIKQLKVNYFIMQTTVGTLHPFIKVSIGNYRTIDLDEANGLRKQTFTNEISPFPGVASLCSAIHGIEYYNSDGIVNEVNVNTEFMGLPANLIKQQVTVGEKGRINYISITTILISTNFYIPNTYLKLGYAFESVITNTVGFEIIGAISDAGVFTTTDNSFFFGMRGFNFTMQNSRIFLLEINTKPVFRDNLLTNIYMKYTEISALVLLSRVCTISTDFYYVQGFQCLPSTCTGYYRNGPMSLCENCASVCDTGCTASTNDCMACKGSDHRVKDSSVLPAVTCVCDYNGGYVQVNGGDVCELCSTYLPGCLKCASSLSCNDCGDTTIYQLFQYDGINWKCRCKFGKYLVTGKCLSYPGCLVANQYVTGEFCQQCDTVNNFQKDLTNNSSCKCMLAYFPDPTNVNKCLDTCGDGFTPNSPSNATQTQIICDDGNTISGDGCSLTCKQQFGYICTVKPPGSISTCAEKQQIKIEYLYSQKNLISNQATIVFALLPPQNSLPQNSFDNLINTNLPGTKKIKFDPKNSLIIITIDYTQTIEEKQYDFNFSFSGLKIYSSGIDKKIKLFGRNAKLQIGKAHPQVNIITYVALAVAAFALVLALVAAFLGEKMMGIELILPIQAAFFTMVTFPTKILSPISALWSLKFSNGYNSLDKFDLTTNYMLDSRVTLLQYSGQYLLNYNIMFSLLALVILIIAIIVIRLAWLQRQQSRLQDMLKKLQDQEKESKQDKDQKKKQKKKQKQKAKQKQKQKAKKQIKDDKQKLSQQQQKLSSQKQTEQQTTKQEQRDEQIIKQQLQDVRENINNWKNFLYMIFDRFFAILIITAMMKVIFCFYVQLSNLSYSNQVFNSSLNAGFFFLTYGTIVTGLYAIVYDYKTDKYVTFTCNKGKYAIFYIAIYLAFIIILGAFYETNIALYVIAIFSILPLVLIPYQIPYGMRVFDLQTIIAFICQFPFIATVAVSFILNFQKTITEQNSMIFAYVIIGTIGLSIILTIARMIKVIDCKKVSCIEFTDRKKDSKNDKNKKKNKIIVIDDLDLPKNNWDQYSQDSVRSVLKQRQYDDQNDQFNIDKQNKQAYDAIAKKNQPKALQKEKSKQKPQEEQDDQQIDELQKIKLKLRKDLKQKKMVGKIK